VVGGRESDRAELVAELVDAVKFVGVVGFRALGDEHRGLVQGPAVQHVHMCDGHRLAGGVKVEQVGKLEAQRVAEEP